MYKLGPSSAQLGPSSAQTLIWLYFIFFLNMFSLDPVRKWEKIIQWSPIWIIFKGEIEIAHLLPERSTRRDDQLLQTWPFLSGALDWISFPFSKSRFWKWGKRPIYFQFFLLKASLNQVGLLSVFVKFQLSSWSRRCLSVCCLVIFYYWLIYTQ